MFHNCTFLRMIILYSWLTANSLHCLISPFPAEAFPASSSISDWPMRFQEGYQATNGRPASDHCPGLLQCTETIHYYQWMGSKVVGNDFLLQMSSKVRFVSSWLLFWKNRQLGHFNLSFFTSQKMKKRAQTLKNWKLWLWTSKITFTFTKCLLFVCWFVLFHPSSPSLLLLGPFPSLSSSSSSSFPFPFSSNTVPSSRSGNTNLTAGFSALEAASENIFFCHFCLKLFRHLMFCGYSASVNQSVQGKFMFVSHGIYKYNKQLFSRLKRK